MSARRIVGFEAWAYTTTEEGEALRELEHLSDRAAGIVAGTLVENSLYGILRYELRSDDKDAVERMFSETGILGTFASKIKMAYALGLISKLAYQDLELIRKIRNDFAHKLSQSDFSSQAINSRCHSLRIVDQVVSFQGSAHPPSEGSSTVPRGGFIFSGENPDILKDARSRFFLTVNYMTTSLLLRRPKPAEVEPYF